MGRTHPKPGSVSRRRWLGVTSAVVTGGSFAVRAETLESLAPKLREIAEANVLDLSGLDEPVVIESIELLKSDSVFLLRTRSRCGREAITVPHQSKTAVCYPILQKNVIPFFVGKDARDLESLLWENYRHRSNYKLQGLAYWIGVAAVEMGILELLGQVSGKPLADFFGGTRHRDVDVYYASSNRGNTPEEEIGHLHQLVDGSGVKALKFRLGGRMSRDADSLPGRSEALIPMVREKFGSEMTLYADSNSSYSSREAIRIGRLMEEHDYRFFEEPCPFDDLWGTKKVADELDIPVAGGEQEYSLHRWQWMIENRAVDIVQPDLHYGGGMIRATKVARMAQVMRMPVVPHMSGGGLGYVEVVQFSSFTPNIGPFMEFKGNARFPVHCETSSLKCKDGSVRCPAGPGFGVVVDPEFVSRAQAV